MSTNRHPEGNEENNGFTSKRYNGSVDDCNISDSSSVDQDDEGDEGDKQLKKNLLIKFTSV